MNWKNFGLNFLQRNAIDIVFGLISNRLKDIPRQRLETWLRHFGQAFGPPGLMHFSELSDNEKQALIARVPVLSSTHTDWLKPFQWVPRTLTVWVGPPPAINDVIDGNVSELKPIPKNGEWYVMHGYMASTTEDGIHNRLGFRYDNVDNIWVLSVALKII